MELLRHGVREYILKPVEREKITAILKTLEEEYEQKRKQAQADHQIGKNQIRYLLMNENPDDKEVQLLEQKYEERFFPGGYQVCVAGKGFQPPFLRGKAHGIARTRCIWMNLGTEMYAFVRLIWHGSCRRMNCGRNAPV